MHIFFLSIFIHVHSPCAGADNSLGPKFWCQQEDLITMVICCKFKKNLLTSTLGDDLNPWGRDVYVNRNIWLLRYFVASLKKIFEVWFYTFFFHDLIHVYIAGQGQTAQGDKILMSTERPYHFTHLLHVSKKSLWSLILYIFFFMI